MYGHPYQNDPRKNGFNMTYSITDIARYAEGDMTAEEQLAFEQELAANVSLQEQLALYHEVHSLLKQHFHKDEQQVQLEETLQQMRGEFFRGASNPAKVVSINRYLRYAVGVAALFLVTLFVWQPWKTDLFEEYAATRMINPTERGENADSLLQHAAVAFNKKDYPAASTLLEKVVKLHPEDAFSSFYYGVALLHTGQTMPSRMILGAIYDGESVFKYEAAFYIALTYLKDEDKLLCREWLQKIPADAANYTKAQELLKKL